MNSKVITMAADNNNEEENHTKAWLEGSMLKVEYYGDVYTFDLTKADEREIERGRFSVVLFDETDSFCVKITSGNSKGVTRNDIYVHNYLKEERLLSKLDSPFIAQLHLGNEGSFKERTEIYFMKNMKQFGAATLDELIDFEETKRENERKGKEVKGYEVTTKTLSLPYALSFYKKLLSQLGILHNAGVIHLDVTPGNVFLKHHTEAEGSHRKKRMRKLKNVILIDDGLARKRDSPIGLFFNQTRAVGSRSAGSYKTCYKGHSGRKTAWYNEDTSPPELMMTNSSDLPAVPSMDIYQATNLLVWTLTGKSAFYLKGRHLTYMMYLLERALQDKELETLDNNRFKTKKKSIDDKIKQSARELQSLYVDLIVATEGKDKAEKIESEINSGVYTTLLECVDLLYSHKIRQIIERKNADVLNDSSKQFLDALLPILVRGTGKLENNYTSVEDLLKPDKSSGELDKLEKSHPDYFNDEFVDDVIGEDAQESLYDKVGGSSLLNGLRKVGEFIGVIPKSPQPASSAQQPQPPATPSAISSATPQSPTASSEAQLQSQNPKPDYVLSDPSSATKQPQPIPSCAVPPPPPKQPLAASPQPSAPQQPLVAQSSTTPKPGDEETLTLDDEVEREVSKLERKLEKGKTPKVPLRINLLAQLKEKYAPWYQKHKKKVIIGGITAAVLGIGGLVYYLYNNYTFCWTSSLEWVCEDKPAPVPPPQPTPPPYCDDDCGGIYYPIPMRESDSQPFARQRRGIEEKLSEPKITHLDETINYPRRHVSDPIEIDLLKKGIDDVKTLDDLAKKLDPEKGIGEIKPDKNIEVKYNPKTGKIKVKPKEEDGKPYMGQAQLSIKTKDGDCSTYCFEFSNKKPEALKKGTVVYVGEHGSKEITLEDYFSDDGGNSKLKVNSVEVFDKGKDVVGEIVAGEIKATKEGRKIPISSKGQDFYTLRTSSGLDANGAVKIRITVSDENYSVENTLWIAVTPVNDCPRLIDNWQNDEAAKIAYIPKGSLVIRDVSNLFTDPDDKNLTIKAKEKTGKIIVDNLGSSLFKINYDDTGDFKILFYAEDGHSGDCQTKDGDMVKSGIGIDVPVVFHSWKSISVDGYTIDYRILDANLFKGAAVGECIGYTPNLDLSKDGRSELEEYVIKPSEKHKKSLDNISGRIVYDEDGGLKIIEGFGYAKQDEKDNPSPDLGKGNSIPNNVRDIFNTDFRPKTPYIQSGQLCVQVKFKKTDQKKEVK